MLWIRIDYILHHIFCDTSKLLLLAVLPIWLCTIFKSAVAELKGHQSEFLYGNKTISPSGRVLLCSGQELYPMRVRAIVAYFSTSTNVIRVQLWYKVTLKNYTLEWESRIQPSGTPGRAVISLPESNFITSSSHHRLGFYCETDPCPIYYAFSPQKETVISINKYINGVGPTINEHAEFNELEFPRQFAIAVCNGSDCDDVLPLPRGTATPESVTTAIDTTTTEKTSKPQGQQQVITAKQSEFLQDSVIVGIFVWLVLLSFVLVSILFLLICIYLRPKQSESSEENKPGDWFIVVEDNKSKSLSNTLFSHPSAASLPRPQSSSSAIEANNITLA